MRVLVYGGGGSGKSEFAEETLCRLAPAGPRLYLATMRPFGPEAEERIRRHRAARAAKGFETAERYGGLADFHPGPETAVLLECLGNLAANAMFADPPPTGDLAGALCRDLEDLAGRARHLVMVANDVFSDGAVYPPETEAYRRLLAGMHRRLAGVCDVVVEVVCGLPLFVKGNGNI